MNLISLFYFTELVKEMNFTRAAEGLFISQQNLTQHIKKLEDHYGVKLFIRRPKLALTQQGSILYESALRILSEENKLLALFHPTNTDTKKLRIGINQFRAAFCMPQILPRFNQAWPEIGLSLEDHPSSKMEEAVTKGELDLFIGIQRNLKSHLQTEKLLDDRLFIVVPQKVKERYFKDQDDWLDYAQEHGTDLKPFRTIPFFQLTKGFRLRKITDACFRIAGFEPVTEFEATSTDLLQSLLSDYAGVSFITEMRVPEIKQKNPDALFLPLLSKDEFVKNPLVIVWHRERPVPSHMADFIQITQEVFRQIDLKRIADIDLYRSV